MPGPEVRADMLVMPTSPAPPEAALNSGMASVSLTLETLTTTKPEVMFIAPNPGPTLTDQWEKSPLWKQVPAVKDNRTFEVDPDSWSRSRGLISAEVVATEAIKLLYGK